MALTTGGIITVTLQVPAGVIVDQLRSKRLILVIASAVLAVGCGSAKIYCRSLGGIHV
jgi:hypothetical protein